nr:hypothetical protein [Micromonospora sp. DSM 115978]
MLFADLAILVVTFAVADDPFVDAVTRAWPLIPIVVLLSLPLVAVSIGKRLFGNVRVTRRELRVGRHAWPVSDLDRDFLKEQRARPEASIVEQWTRTMARVNVPARDTGPQRPDLAKARVLGGGHGLPAGADEMLLLRRDGSVWTMATKNRTELLDALIRVVPA